MGNYPNGVWLKIKRHTEEISDCRLFEGYLLSFTDCVPIAPESREVVISNGLADIVVESISREYVVINDLHNNKLLTLTLGQNHIILSKEYGQVEINVYGLRIGADKSNWDEWVKV